LKILITGATGYIGTHLIKIAKAYEHEVCVATRHPPSNLYFDRWVRFDLLEFDKPTANSLNIPFQIDAIVHLAAITNSEKNNSNAQIEATRLLLLEARTRNIPFVFISSQTAQANAPTEYGRCKFALEQLVKESSGYIVRPGQVYGGHEGGQFGTFVRFLRKSVFYPKFLPKPFIQPIHVDDLAHALLKVSELPPKKGQSFNVAENTPIEFDKFLSLIGTQWVKRPRIGLALPRWTIALMRFAFGSKLSEKAGLNRFQSLFALKHMATEIDLASLDITPRSVVIGMHPSGNSARRSTSMEGSAFLHYILQRKPSLQMIKQYVRAVELLTNQTHLAIPKWFLFLPSAIALIDRKDLCEIPGGSEVLRRLNFALVIAEASPESANQFLNLSQKSSLQAFYAGFAITKAVAADCFWLLAARLTHPFYRPSFINKSGT
jgi:nucleoside-diphosphate-sugar epimerase